MHIFLPFIYFYFLFAKIVVQIASTIWDFEQQQFLSEANNAHNTMVGGGEEEKPLPYPDFLQLFFFTAEI